MESKFVERLRPQIKPGCIAGFIVGVFLIGINYVTPSELIANAPLVNLIPSNTFGHSVKLVK